MRVIVSGGGTAGHIYPALTVAAELAAARDDVTFVGTPGGLEARLVPEAGVAFRPLAASGFDRSRPWTLVTGSARIAASAVKAWRWMSAEKPDVVVGFGGYVSIPVALGARWAGVPVVLHEQNSVPGLANRVCSKWARAVAVTYEESAGLLAHPERAQVTGNPVRPEVLKRDRAAGRAALGLAPDALVVLAFGGSRGARHLNSALVGLAPQLLSLPEVTVLHVAGRLEADSVREALAEAGIADTERWRVLDYLDDMGSAIAAADLVICRAGATTIAELTALGAPAVLVPYPYATDDHQTKNGAAMVAHGAAVMVADEDLDSPRLGDTLMELLGDAERRANMAALSRGLGHTDAAQRVADMVHAAARPSDEK